MTGFERFGWFMGGVVAGMAATYAALWVILSIQDRTLKRFADQRYEEGRERGARERHVRTGDRR